MDNVTHEKYMQMALKQALTAWQDFDEVPVGAVVVQNHEVIAQTHNLKESQNQATYHAEILAIEAASKALGRWRLEDCDLYVTLEPCPMCAGALIQARFKNLYFGAFDPKAGACSSLYNITTDSRLNHNIPTHGGILEEDCSLLLKKFFQSKRTKNEAPK